MTFFHPAAPRTRGPRRRSLPAAIIGLASLTAGLGGCVNQQQYDEAVSEIRTLTSRNQDLTSRLAELESQADQFRRSGSGAASALSQIEAENARLRQQLADASRDLASLEERLGGLDFGRLDPATDAALADLARRFPGLVSYDPERGMLRFNSDLTFDSGSDVVKDSAKASLQALAQVLNAPEAQQYDTRIVGHTDSQRVSAATAARHPTNVHLSAHRAISVRRELMGLGVPEARMQVAGWGEFRPAVPNNPSGNTPQNRRVEVFLVRGTGGAVSSAPAATGVSGVDSQRLGGQAYEPTK